MSKGIRAFLLAATPSRFLGPALALALLMSLSGRDHDASAATAAAIAFPASTCAQGASVVTFTWQPGGSGITQQWLDLSDVDNDFAPGTFSNVRLGAAVNDYTWLGVKAAVPHFWRVNSLTSEGWITSETGSFVPCGGAALLFGPLKCDGTTSATVNFRWIPASSAGIAQWLDLGTDGGFAPDTFSGAGPLAPTATSYQWSDIKSDVAYSFRVNTLTQAGWVSSQIGGFKPACNPNAPVVIRPDLYGSDDRLVVARLGINAQVNVRDVGYDGELGNPVGADDVVRYNFAALRGLGGYPGNGGNTVIAGHVDYICCLAVFAPLRNVQVGDIIDYYRGDGGVIEYQVDWFDDLSPDTNWNGVVAATRTESITLITCNGTFNVFARDYSHRRVVHGVRTN